MKSSEFKVQSSTGKRGRDVPLSERGFTYIALLVAIVIIGISLGSAARSWQNISLRDKEEELLFRGDQYRLALERYSHAIPGKVQYPENLDDLLNDDRTPAGRRFLRQKFKDPISGEDFMEIRDPATKRIIGVNSPSEKEPLKKSNFPEPYKDFEQKGTYREWTFKAMK